MNHRLFISLAKGSMIRNRRSTLPYVMSITGMVLMYFILATLASTPSLMDIYGARTLRRNLEFGQMVMSVFTVIVVFYTHSFLILKRKREFALFHILGMEKRHLARMLLWETIFVTIITTILGLALGAVFAKLIYLLLLRLLGTALSPQLVLPGRAFATTALLFLFTQGLTMLSTLRQLAVTRPAELLQSANQGERDPKARGFLALIGALCLGSGYALSQMVTDPIAAATYFFLAVLLVILGTYALFLAGAVTILKALRRWKRFYYKARNYTVVAGLIHRMRRNAIGLATICILSTMVLVMVSATASIYVGSDHAFRQALGRDATVRMHGVLTHAHEEVLTDQVQQAALRHGITLSDPLLFRVTEVWGYVNDTRDKAWSTTTPREQATDASAMGRFFIIFAEDYPAITGQPLTLSPGQILALTTGSHALSTQVDLFGLPFEVIGTLPEVPPMGYYRANTDSDYFLVMQQADQQAMRSALLETEYHNAASAAQKAGEELGISHEDFMSGETDFNLTYAFDTGTKDTMIINAFAQDLQTKVADAYHEQFAQGVNIAFRHIALELADFNAQFGGLLFVAAFLGLLFMLALVLIIYFKQVSEGYEDRGRFVILRQVGMSGREVRQSIRRQVLLVFFLPLVVAGVHSLMAFHIISRILGFMELKDMTLYARIAMLTFSAFSLLYLAIYLQTARSYYKIVGQAKMGLQAG